MAAAGTDSPAAQQALESLCNTYWFPLYAYVRRRGNGPEDAQDLTQEFLARLLEKKWLADLEPRTARFRSFLLTAFERFLINEYDRSRAAKRGGGKTVLSLDQQRAEGRYASEPVTTETPERMYDRRWALTLLDQAFSRLQREITSSGKAKQFELLNPFLSREADAGEYLRIAQELNVNSGTIGVTVHRLRQRYRELVREEVANTVFDSTEVDGELQYLFSLLRGGNIP